MPIVSQISLVKFMDRALIGGFDWKIAPHSLKIEVIIAQIIWLGSRHVTIFSILFDLDRDQTNSRKVVRWPAPNFQKTVGGILGPFCTEFKFT